MTETDATRSEGAVAGAARCELCGAFTDQRIWDRTICASCYEERSSCCPEFGSSDLWNEREDL